MLGKTTLGRSVLIFALLAIMLPIFAISYLLLSYYQDEAVKDLEKRSRQLASTVRNGINYYIGSPFRFASSFAEWAKNPSFAQNIDEILAQNVQSHGFYESILVLDRRGIVRHLGAPSGAAIRKEDFLGLDLSRAEFVATGLRSRTPAWSDTFISTVTNEPTLSLSYPYDGGVIVFNMDLNYLNDFIRSSGGSASDLVYVVNAKGRIIAHPDRHVVLQQTGVANLPSVEAGLQGREGCFEYLHDGRRVIGTTARVPLTGWLVIVEQNKREVFAHLWRMEAALILFLLISLMLIGLLILYIQKRIVRPVTALSTATRSVADGTYLPLPEDRSSFPEIREMISSFNTMSASLQQREKDLQAKNRALMEALDHRAHFETALANEKTFSDTIIDSLPGIFYVCDEQCRLLRMNDNEKASTGYSPEELLRLNVADLFPTDRAATLLKMREVFEAGHAVWEATLVTRAGTQVPYYLTGFRMGLKDHRYAVGVGIDISERRRLEQQLLQAQKMEAIGALAGGIAHDFNNILSAIIGYASILQMKLGPGDPLGRSVEQILSSSERAAGLTKSLLSFSRKQVVELKPVNIGDLIGGFQKILARLIGEDIEFKIRPAREDLIVMADKGQLEQVLMNLVTNARDAMPRGGTIEIAVEKKLLDAGDGVISRGDYAALSVTDTGTGMDEQELQHIFEPFYTTKDAGKGTGLGLAIVYGIVRKHNGTIHVSSAPGHGSTFRVYLPLATVTETAPAEPAVLLPSGAETILLVEDEETVRSVIRMMLDEYGYTVIEAADGEEALRLFRADPGRIDLVLCDLIMPRLNGSETCREIRKIRPDIRTLFMSGYTADIISQKGIRHDAAPILFKPVTLSELLTTIRTVLMADPVPLR